MSLSDRIRPNCEAAPWVVKEVKSLENKLSDAHKRIAELELSLAALGNLAVGYWDDSTVGAVDQAVAYEQQRKYKDQLRSLFNASTELSDARSEIKRLGTMADKLLAHLDDGTHQSGGECTVCSTICCPDSDLLHFHHDGCPSCSEKDPK